MSLPTRRTFLKQTAAMGAAVAVPYLVPSTVFGANEAIRVAVAGINGRGQSHIDAFTTLPGCKVTYLVDPDSRLFDKRSAGVEKRGGNRPKCVQDIRKALEDPNLDVVSIATCNHWHSLITIWACQAGKDVYVEKPCSHNVFEGRKCVEAARRYKRIVQHGTQSRSSKSWAKAIAAVKSGKYGKLLISYGSASKPRNSIGFKEVKQPPKELDYNLWLGPAPELPYHENLVHYNWHWFWETGNGEIGNQGVHQMDIARWAISGVPLPKSVISLGGRFGYKDQGQTPNTQLAFYDYGDTKLFFEVRGLKTKKVTNEFYLEAGVIKETKDAKETKKSKGSKTEKTEKKAVDSDYEEGKLAFYPKGKDQPEPLADVQYTVHPNGPFGNFIDCVRSRRQDQLNAEILEGHLSAALCHLGNISYRLGTDVPFSKQTKAFGDDKHAYEALESMKEHLSKEVGLKLEEIAYRLGRKLDFDPQAEKFINCPEADALLTRNYRKPFVVPETV